MIQSLSSIKKWKATEFRFFLLYCGPLVMKGLLTNNQYSHFLNLHVALKNSLFYPDVFEIFVSGQRLFEEIRFIMQ